MVCHEIQPTNQKCTISSRYHPVYTASCEGRKLEKEILAIKQNDNDSYYEARKMVAVSETTTNSKCIQMKKHNIFSG